LSCAIYSLPIIVFLHPLKLCQALLVRLPATERCLPDADRDQHALRKRL
jgi:hypothetical protein